MKTLLCYLLPVLALTLPASGHAATEATDQASNYAGLLDYVGVNRGSGYTSGFTNPGSTSGSFLGSSSQINTAGLAFGVQSAPSTANSVRRLFPSNSTLSVGQYFRIQLQPVSVGSGGSFSVQLRNTLNTTGTDAFLSYSSASPNYVFLLRELNSPFTSYTTRTFDTGVPFSTNGLTMDFFQTPGGVRLSLTPFGGSTTSYSDTIAGLFSSFYVNTFNATVYFNNPTIIPEPSVSFILLLALPGALWFYLARRRRAV